MTSCRRANGRFFRPAARRRQLALSQIWPVMRDRCRAWSIAAFGNSDLATKRGSRSTKPTTLGTNMKQHVHSTAPFCTTSSGISCLSFGPSLRRRPSVATKLSYRAPACARAALAAGSGSGGVVLSQKRMNSASVSTPIPTSRSSRARRRSSTRQLRVLMARLRNNKRWPYLKNFSHELLRNQQFPAIIQMLAITGCNQPRRHAPGRR